MKKLIDKLISPILLMALFDGIYREDYESYRSSKFRKPIAKMKRHRIKNRKSIKK